MAEQDKEEQESLSRFATYGRFGDVARRNLARMEELIGAMPPEPPFAPEGPERDTWDLYQHETGETREEIDEYAAIVVIFTAAAAELTINDAGARLLGDTYYTAHVEALDLLSKWVVVPRLINGYEIDRGGRAYELLKSVVTTRNALMHPKSQPFTVERFYKSAKTSLVASARIAGEALERLLEETRKFDRHNMSSAHL
jgi:hypothetical protein